MNSTTHNTRLLTTLVQVIIDITIAFFAVFVALLLKYDGSIPITVQNILPPLLVTLGFGKTAINFLLGSYRSFWRYTSLLEARTLLYGSLVSTTIISLANFLIFVLIVLLICFIGFLCQFSLVQTIN